MGGYTSNEMPYEVKINMIRCTGSDSPLGYGFLYAKNHLCKRLLAGVSQWIRTTRHNKKQKPQPINSIKKALHCKNPLLDIS
jgi:hypothetical protein